MTPTTLGALLDALDALVLALVPSELAMRSRTWSLVDDIDKVSGGEVRAFYIDATSPVAVVGGIHSPSAVEMETTIKVYTSYKNLRRREKTALAGADSAQLWIDWDIRRDSTVPGTVPGLISVEQTGFEDEDEEQARQWGAHTFEVRFLGKGVPT
jgi:hypothetical protein